MAYWRAYYHVVWTTHERLPFITPEIEGFVHRTITSKLIEEGGKVYAINGMEDHVHLVSAIPPSKSVAHMVKAIKGSTSHLMTHEQGMTFKWQGGYGLFTMGPQGRKMVIDYVNCQKQHHRDGTLLKYLEYATDREEGPRDE